MNSINWKDVFIRGVKSAVQGALSVTTVAAVFEFIKPDLIDLSGLGQLALIALVSAGTGFYAVLHNALLQWSSSE